MKQNTNFPYDVKATDQKNQAEPKELDSTSDSLKYEYSVPGYLMGDPLLAPLLDKLDLVAEINCSATMTRLMYKGAQTSKIEFQIPLATIENSFTIDLMLLLKESAVFDSMNLNKGMPLAHLGSFKVYLDEGAQSLFYFEPHDKEELEYSFSDHQIHVKIPQEQFDWLLQRQNHPMVKGLLSSQFAQIALLGACHLLKENGNDHKLWFKALTEKWMEYSKGDGEIQPSDFGPFVNYILEKPSVSLINVVIQNIDRE
ncbi:MAG: hypothetical protein FJX80_08295 [Bacteroidetes bacterium]|nr:hypothetical protein [Bacteroidota bacterium]